MEQAHRGAHIYSLHDARVLHKTKKGCSLRCERLCGVSVSVCVRIHIPKPNILSKKALGKTVFGPSMCLSRLCMCLVMCAPGVRVHKNGVKNSDIFKLHLRCDAIGWRFFVRM